MHTYGSYDSEIRMRILTHRFHRIILPPNIVKQKKNQKNIINVAHGNMTPNQQIKFFCIIMDKLVSVIRMCLDAPRKPKYAVQNISNRNRGSASLEAVCVMPIMVFAFWAFYSMGQIYIAENQIYQAAMNTVDYLAEYAYLAEDIDIPEYVMAAGKLREYLPENQRIEQYVTGGRQGVSLMSPVTLDEEGFLCVIVQYQIRIPVPFFHSLSMPVKVQVRQKAYTGYQGNGNVNENEQYVYLAEYSSVYHISRNCSHLKLTIIPVSETVLRTSYFDLEPCAYCGDVKSETYYITETGDCYHSTAQCSGLKRTVRRVKRSEAAGYAPCSRCGEGE